MHLKYSQNNPYLFTFTLLVDESHWKRPYVDNLTLSSIGVGTYLGAPDQIDDLKVSE